MPNFQDKYIASNLDVIDPKTGERVPLSQRYKKFKTKNQGINIVAFGFLFDFTGNANNSFVQKVEDTVREKWFQDAIHEQTDVFIVIGHVGLRMPEFKTIFTAIRKQNWDTPILVFGGHAHVRDARIFDSKSIAMASGRYFETIGWMSVDGLKSQEGRNSPGGLSSAASGPKFTRRYIDNNLYGMYHHSGTNASTFDTKHGQRVTNMITRARKALNLDYQFGCAPKDLWMSRVPYDSEDSIFSWIQNEVFPGIISNPKRKDKARLAIMNTGGIRFDIFKGPFTTDSTFIVSPFVSGFNYIPDVPYHIAKNIIVLLNGAGKIFAEAGYDTKFLTVLPQQMFSADVAPDAEVDVETDQPDSVDDSVQLELRSLKMQHPSDDDDEQIILTGGYTTVDDLGTDGDDTVHKPVKFYNVPNCVQSEIGFPEDGSEPDVVDLVFLDFVQPWIVLALKFSGGTQGAADVEQYMEGTFTYKLSEWIKDNWSGDC